MKKSILLLLLLISGSIISQTKVYDTPVKYKQVSTLNSVTTTTPVPVFGADGLLQKVILDDLPVSTLTQEALDLKLSKTGEVLNYSTDFDPLFSQDPTSLVVKKRTMQPESSRFDPTLAPIYAWGDSMTDGYLTTNYPTQLTALFGYPVTNRGVGGENSTQIKNRLVAETAAYSKSVIIWVGRNNIGSPATIKADIATMISTIGHTRYLVVGVVNSATEPINSANWTLITTLNNDLKALYGSKFVSIREQIVSKYNPSLPQDVIDHANDVPPESLRLPADPLHLNTAGQTVVAEFFNQRLGNMFDKNGYLQSKDFKYYSNLYSDYIYRNLNDTFTGIKYSTNTGTTQINGLGLTNNGTTSNSQVLLINNTSTGNGLTINNTGSIGQYTINALTGTGQYTRNLAGGSGYGGENVGAGTFMSLNSATGSSGFLLVFRKNGAATSSFDQNGILRTPPPLITSAPVTSAGSYDFLTRNIVTDQVEKIPSANVATSASVALKQDALVSGTNIKTVNGNVLPGSGNVSIDINGALNEGSTAIGKTLNLMSADFTQVVQTTPTNLNINQIDLSKSAGIANVSGNMHLYGSNPTGDNHINLNNRTASGTAYYNFNPSNTAGTYTLSTTSDITLQNVVNTAPEAYKGSSYVSLLYGAAGSTSSGLVSADLTSTNIGALQIQNNAVLLQNDSATDFGIFKVNGGLIDITQSNITASKTTHVVVDTPTANTTVSVPAPSVDGSYTLALEKYKSYVAVLNQTGTSAPVATVLENSLSGTIVWSYVSTGIYDATLAGAFNSSKTAVFFNKGEVTGTTSGKSGAFVNTSDTVRVMTVSNGSSSNGEVNKATIEIRVYP